MHCQPVGSTARLRLHAPTHGRRRHAAHHSSRSSSSSSHWSLATPSHLSGTGSASPLQLPLNRRPTARQQPHRAFSGSVPQHQRPAAPSPPPPPPAAAAAAEASSVAAGDGLARAARLAAPVVVVGGGPAGLSAALMLARRGYTQVKVFERLPEPPAPDDLSVWADFETASERLYMIGLNGRGQAVLRGLGVMETIDAAASLVLGRLDWQPDSPPDKPKLTRYGATRSYVTRCIQRDRLAGCLLRELREKHASSISVVFGARCVSAQWSQQQQGGGGSPREVCTLTFQRQQQQQGDSSTGGTSSSSAAAAAAAAAATPEADEWTEVSSFVIGADGRGSALRAAMEASSSSSFGVRRFQDRNVIVYRTIPLWWPPQMAAERPGDLNYSIRTKSGLSLDCLPTREGPFIGVMLYKPGDERITALRNGADVRALFVEHFPAFVPALRESDLERFAAKSDSSLPTFSYAGPVLHHGGSMALVGDAIHTVKPFFGQGVNSAFEDVKVLQQALDDTDDEPAAAVQRYSKLRAKDAEALVKLSHSLDGGFLTFVGPLILDSLLNRLLPAVFSPNIIASLQNEQWTFARIRARKRVDRALQVALIAGLVWVLVRVASLLLGLAGRLVKGGVAG